jgi:hypothetical protein
MNAKMQTVRSGDRAGFGFWCVLVLLLTFAPGCRSPALDDASSVPWNAPRSWEQDNWKAVRPKNEPRAPVPPGDWMGTGSFGIGK